MLSDLQRDMSCGNKGSKSVLAATGVLRLGEMERVGYEQDVAMKSGECVSIQ